MFKTGLHVAGVLCALFVIDVVLASPKVLGLDFQRGFRPASPAAKLRRRQDSVEADITNAEIFYQINVTIGNPPQAFGLQLDTGSSDTWVPSVNADICLAGRERCVRGAFDASESTTAQTVFAPDFEIAYVDSSQVSGTYFTDTLVMGTTKIVKMQMGLAASSPNRDFGIMGIGFSSGEAVVQYYPGAEYPNIVNQLKNQGYINTLAYSLWLNDLESSTGSILFGGVDTEKYDGDLTVIPIQPDEQTGGITSMTVVLSSISMTNKAEKRLYSEDNINVAVILDCGATDTYLPDDIADPILRGVGAVANPFFGYLVPCSIGGSNATFTFTFAESEGPAIRVEISQFVRPIPQGIPPVRFDDGVPACIWGLQPAGPRPNLFGDTFLRSAYVVYNLETAQIGMAQTNFNSTSSNIVEFTDEEIPNASATVIGVAVTQTYAGIPIPTQDLYPPRGATPVVGGHPSPTFDLQAAATSSRPPRMETAIAIAGAICILSFVWGFSVV